MIDVNRIALHSITTETTPSCLLPLLLLVVVVVSVVASFFLLQILESFLDEHLSHSIY